MGTPLPNVPGAVRLQYHFSLGTDANVMTHLYFAGGVSSLTTADLQAFTNLARSSYVTNCLPLSTNNVKLGQVVGTDLTTTTSLQVVAGGSNQGTRALSSGPASVCVLTNFKIARRYRGGKPRVYWPWGNSGDNSDPDTWSASFVTLCQNGINALVAALQGFSGSSFASPTLSNISYWHAGSPRTTPVVDPVTAVVVNPIPATQRRRLRP